MIDIAKEMEKFKKDLRTSHILMGDQKTLSHDTTHKGTFSDNKAALVQSPEEKKHNEKLSNFLKKESFKVGTFHNHLINQKTLQNFYTSVYKNTTDLDRIKLGKAAELSGCNALLASVNLGSFKDRNYSISENKARFNQTATGFMDKAK